MIIQSGDPTIYDDTSGATSFSFPVSWDGGSLALLFIYTGSGITSISSDNSAIGSWTIMTTGSSTAHSFFAASGIEIWSASLTGIGTANLTITRPSPSVPLSISIFAAVSGMRSAVLDSIYKTATFANNTTPIGGSLTSVGQSTQELYFYCASDTIVTQEPTTPAGFSVMFQHRYSDPVFGHQALACYIQNTINNAAGTTLPVPTDGFTIGSSTWFSITTLLKAYLYSSIVSRNCIRLAEPSPSTYEQSNTSPFTLQVTVTLPIAIVRAYASLIPTTGPDTLVINYSDEYGQADTLTRNVTLWMSDNAYLVISPDGLNQLAVASVDGSFYDANAVNINTRNTNASATALLPCSNASRYDAPKMITNQQLPLVQIFDGTYVQTV